MASEAPASAPAAADAAATFPVAAVVGMIYALVDANDSLIFAFLPGWFLDNGVSIAKSGAAFAANGIMMMITSLLVPQLMGGRRRRQNVFLFIDCPLCGFVLSHVSALAGAVRPECTAHILRR
jgi:cyanate permease